MNKISLVVITDGRQSCIEQTIDRFNEVINYNFFEKLIINDSGDPRYHDFLPTLVGFFQKTLNRRKLEHFFQSWFFQRPLATLLDRNVF